jgi:hypothetical protein
MRQDRRRGHAKPDAVSLGVIGRRADGFELTINNRLKGTG